MQRSHVGQGARCTSPTSAPLLRPVQKVMYASIVKIESQPIKGQEEYSSERGSRAKGGEVHREAWPGGFQAPPHPVAVLHCCKPSRGLTPRPEPSRPRSCPAAIGWPPAHPALPPAVLRMQVGSSGTSNLWLYFVPSQVVSGIKLRILGVGALL